MIKLVPYSMEFLNRSWDWLNDPEIKALTLSKSFSREQQQNWFASLPLLSDYKIWGVQLEDEPIGACGLKNITSTDAEYWGYIGEKNFWSKGYGQIMLLAMIGEAKKLDLKTLYLKVGVQNLRAIRLYEKTGFRPLESTSSDNVQMMALHL